MISPAILWFVLAIGIRCVAALSTGGDSVYHDIGRTLPSTGSVVFTLKACNDAVMALSTTAGSLESNTYEIVIGGWNNERCAVRRCLQCAEEENPMTIGILNCDYTLPFWLSWGNSQVSLGTGYSVGESEVMSYTDPNPYTIHALAVATGGGSTGEWYFYHDRSAIPVETTISTGADGVYQDIGLSLATAGHIVFNVKACNDALFALSTTAGSYDSNTYEIVIGGWNNERCAIKRCRECDPQANPTTPGILNCDEYRAFWVSWGSGKVLMGSGSTPGQSELMSYTDPSPYTIHAAAVATGWAGATGEWSFMH